MKTFVSFLILTIFQVTAFSQNISKANLTHKFPASVIDSNYLEEYLKCFDTIDNAWGDTTLTEEDVQNFLQRALTLYEKYPKLQENKEAAFDLFTRLASTYSSAPSTYQKAYDFYTRASLLGKQEYSNAMWQRGQMLYNHEKYEEANKDFTAYIRTLDKATERESYEFAVVYRLNCYRKLGDQVGMIGEYNLLINSYTSLAKKCSTYGERGQTKYLLGDYYGAVKDLNIAIGLLANSKVNNPADYYFHRSYMHLAMKNYTQALNDSNKAIQLNKNCASCYYNRGFIKRDMKNKAGACADWSKAGEMGMKEAYEAIRETCN